jgi:hypothetical protein
VAIVAGLVLLLAGGGAWVSSVDRRSVGGVVVAEPEDTPGTAYAPLAVVLGLGAVAGGVALAGSRGRVRRVTGVVVALVGVVALAVVAEGLLDARTAEGRLTPAPFFALVAGVALAVAGVAAVRGHDRPPRASQYRVAAERAGDDEWSLAADEEPPAD